MRLPEPQFEGQTKEVLGTPAVRNIVAAVVAKALGDRFGSSKRRRQEPVGARARQDRLRDEGPGLGPGAQGDPAAQERPGELGAAGEARSTAASNDVAQSELFIVEGDSALGTAKLARDSEYQALLPIRGKILNVQKAFGGRHAVEHRVRLDHPGDRRRAQAARFELDQARYGKVIIMSDADVDGAHIRTLLLDAVLPLHARHDPRRPGASQPCRRCTGS